MRMAAHARSAAMTNAFPAAVPQRPLLSVIAGSFNEEGNVDEWFERTLAACDQFAERYDLEFVWIDNASTDRTVDKVTAWCARDSRVKLIVNARNFGPVRSPFHALMQANGVACIYLASDLQDLPELSRTRRPLGAWLRRRGRRVQEQYRRLLHCSLRDAYYSILARVSDSDPVIRAFTGFGLYSRRVVEHMRRHQLPESDGAFPGRRGRRLAVDDRRVRQARAQIRCDEKRFPGAGIAVLSLTSMSKAPIRVATITGLGRCRRWDSSSPWSISSPSCCSGIRFPWARRRC